MCRSTTQMAWLRKAMSGQLLRAADLEPIPQRCEQTQGTDWNGPDLFSVRCRVFRCGAVWLLAANLSANEACNEATLPAIAFCPVMTCFNKTTNILVYEHEMCTPFITCVRLAQQEMHDVTQGVCKMYMSSRSTAILSRIYALLQPKQGVGCSQYCPLRGILQFSLPITVVLLVLCR